MKWVIVLLMSISVTNLAWSKTNVVNQEMTPPHSCPQDLSKLRPQVESILASVSSPDFKTATLSSLSASIPDAIQQADGLNEQIAYLQSEIVEQRRLQRYSEKIARDARGDFGKALKPCSADEKGSYCTAVEQYYISTAAILVHGAFLDALKCYKQQGMH